MPTSTPAQSQSTTRWTSSTLPGAPVEGPYPVYRPSSEIVTHGNSQAALPKLPSRSKLTVPEVPFPLILPDYTLPKNARVRNFERLLVEEATMRDQRDRLLSPVFKPTVVYAVEEQQEDESYYDCSTTNESATSVDSGDEMY